MILPDTLIIWLTVGAGMATMFLSVPICVRAIRALWFRELVVTPRTDHPAHRFDRRQLAIRQGILFLALGLFFMSCGILVILVVVQNFGLSWVFGH
jgi:hypothetical protein